MRSIQIGFMFLVLIVSTVNAVTMRADVFPKAAPDTIASGVPFEIELYMQNDDGIIQLGHSFSLIFYSPDNSIEHASHFNVQGAGAQTIDFPHIQYNDSSILFHNGFNDYWNVMNCWYGWGWTGDLPDTLNHTAATINGWPPDSTEKLYVTIAFLISDTGTFCVDSLDHPEDAYDWLFDPASGNHPFGGPYCWQVAKMPFLCGDINFDGEINILDLTYIIAFLYQDGPAPIPMESANVNNDVVINILDITYLITYLYKGGPEPNCP